MRKIEQLKGLLANAMQMLKELNFTEGSINPLKRSQYERLCDKGFKDLADKVNELVEEFNKRNTK